MIRCVEVEVTTLADLHRVRRRDRLSDAGGVRLEPARLVLVDDEQTGRPADDADVPREASEVGGKLLRVVSRLGGHATQGCLPRSVHVAGS
jgi:hypothetical protein